MEEDISKPKVLKLFSSPRLQGDNQVLFAEIHSKDPAGDCLFTRREDHSKPVYKTMKSGEPHMLTFSSTMEVEGELFYGMSGRSKKVAEIKAAKVAYTSLIERGQNRCIGFTLRTVEAEEM